MHRKLLYEYTPVTNRCKEDRRGDQFGMAESSICEKDSKWIPCCLPIGQFLKKRKEATCKLPLTNPRRSRCLDVKNVLLTDYPWNTKTGSNGENCKVNHLFPLSPLLLREYIREGG